MVFIIFLLKTPQNSPSEEIINPLVIVEEKKPVEKVAWVRKDKPEPSSLPAWAENVKIIVKEFSPFGKKVVLEALLISWQESGWRSNATHRNKNGTIDKGLWQLNSQYHTNDKCSFNPECSTKKAVELYKKYGWRLWYGRRILKIFKN